MNLKELDLWVKESLAKDNRAFINDKVKESVIHKVRSHLKSLQALIDLVTKNTVKNNQYMNQIEQDLEYLTKWDYPPPHKKDSVLPSLADVKQPEAVKTDG